MVNLQILVRLDENTGGLQRAPHRAGESGIELDAAQRFGGPAGFLPAFGAQRAVRSALHEAFFNILRGPVADQVYMLHGSQF